MTPLSGDAPPQASSHRSPEQASELAPEQAINEFIKRLPAPCRLLVAFSGGGDSTGLLAALSAVRRDHPELSLHAATVDHGLRAGSAAEAEAASLTSRVLGVPHTILQWTGAKPATGIQAAARDARYSLLATEAERVGADFIVTGHSRDDQDETVFMRSQRRSGRVEGMDGAVLVDRRVWVVRPFLEVGREAIRDYLRSREIAWSEDPSNDNAAFERVRVRQSGVLAGTMRVVESGPNPFLASAEFVRDNVTVLAGPVATVDLRHCDPRDPPHWRAIAALAAILGGRVHGPDDHAGKALVQKLSGPVDFRATASRVLFDRRGSTLYLYREGRGLPEITVEPGQSACWDGRYEIVNGGPGPVTVGAGRTVAGCAPLLNPVRDDMLPRDVAGRVAVSTPRIIHGHAGGLVVRAVLAPFDKFLPARKLALANSLAAAFELEQFPSLSLSKGAF